MDIISIHIVLIESKCACQHLAEIQEKNHLLMDTTPTRVVRGNGKEEEREKVSCNARSSGYSFPNMYA